MYLIDHVYYEKKICRQWTKLVFDTYEEAHRRYHQFVKKYGYCFQQWVDFKTLKDEIKFTHNDYKICLGLTDIGEYRKPDTYEIEIGNSYLTNCDDVNRGYSIFKNELLAVKAIDPMWEMNDTLCAMDAEKTGYCKIIPIKELPKQFPFLMYQWVDTPENRANIEKYTCSCMEKYGHVPSEFRPFGRAERHYDLEPCPFCTGKAYLQRHYRSYVNQNSTNAAYVRCVKCNARGPKFRLEDYGDSKNYSTKAEEMAVNAWNARPIVK